jgi:hypothetical protein
MGTTVRHARSPWRTRDGGDLREARGDPPVDADEPASLAAGDHDPGLRAGVDDGAEGARLPGAHGAGDLGVVVDADDLDADGQLSASARAREGADDVARAAGGADPGEAVSLAARVHPLGGRVDLGRVDARHARQRLAEGGHEGGLAVGLDGAVDEEREGARGQAREHGVEDARGRVVTERDDAGARVPGVGDRDDLEVAVIADAEDRRRERPAQAAVADGPGRLLEALDVVSRARRGRGGLRDEGVALGIEAASEGFDQGGLQPRRGGIDLQHARGRGWGLEGYEEEGGEHPLSLTKQGGEEGIPPDAEDGVGLPRVRVDGAQEHADLVRAALGHDERRRSEVREGHVLLAALSVADADQSVADHLDALFGELGFRRAPGVLEGDAGHAVEAGFVALEGPALGRLCFDLEDRARGRGDADALDDGRCVALDRLGQGREGEEGEGGEGEELGTHIAPTPRGCFAIPDREAQSAGRWSGGEGRSP